MSLASCMHRAVLSCRAGRSPACTSFRHPVSPGSSACLEDKSGAFAEIGSPSPSASQLSQPSGPGYAIGSRAKGRPIVGALPRFLRLPLGWISWLRSPPPHAGKTGRDRISERPSAVAAGVGIAVDLRSEGRVWFGDVLARCLVLRCTPPRSNELPLSPVVCERPAGFTLPTPQKRRRRRERERAGQWRSQRRRLR